MFRGKKWAILVKTFFLMMRRGVVAENQMGGSRRS